MLVGMLLGIVEDSHIGESGEMGAIVVEVWRGMQRRGILDERGIDGG